MLKFFYKLFGIKRQTQDSEMKKYLIVGLGNPGEKYHDTRHNIGFQILDHYAEKKELKFETKKLGDMLSFQLKGRRVFFLKPNTYMNLSGKAATYWKKKEKIQDVNFLVLTDDLNLPFGSLRLKTKGSDGGHNGLRDMQEWLASTKYNRLRFGIGDAFGKGRQVDFVLSPWSEEERNKLPERLDTCCDLLNSFVLAGVTETMNNFNGK